MRTSVFVTIILLFLLGCSPSPAPQAPPAAPLPAPPVAAPVPSPPLVVANETSNVSEQPEEGVYERPPVQGRSIAQFLQQFRNDVKNYRFTYRNDQWFVQGARAKIILFRVLQNTYHAPFVDTIYLDLEHQTATGVCDGRDKNIKLQCAQRRILGAPYALPYVQFKIKLPEDWLTEFQNRYLAESDTPRLVIDRPTVHLQYRTQTQATDLFIDPANGLPVAVIDDGTEYHYDKLAKNAIGAEQLAP